MEQDRKQDQKQERPAAAAVPPPPPPPPPPPSSTSTASRAAAGTGTGAGRSAHQVFQAAHDEYFQELNDAWNETPRRLQDLQVEIRRELERAWDERAPQAVQDAATRYQQEALRLMQEAWPADRFSEAYKRYKSAMQQALSGAKLDDLDMITLYNVLQSLLVVGQTATQLDPYRLAVPPTGR